MSLQWTLITISWYAYINADLFQFHPLTKKSGVGVCSYSYVQPTIQFNAYTEFAVVWVATLYNSDSGLNQLRLFFVSHPVCRSEAFRGKCGIYENPLDIHKSMRVCRKSIDIDVFSSIYIFFKCIIYVNRLFWWIYFRTYSFESSHLSFADCIQTQMICMLNFWFAVSFKVATNIVSPHVYSQVILFSRYRKNKIDSAYERLSTFHT